MSALEFYTDVVVVGSVLDADPACGPDSENHPWRGTHFSVQVHRLLSAGTSVVNEAISSSYGNFDSTLAFSTLRPAARR